MDHGKSVGRKISNGKKTEKYQKRPKNRTIKPLPEGGGGGGQRKKDRKIAKIIKK